MFAGHIGAGLALGRVERRVNVGVLVLAALLLDAALWVFVLLGWETVTIPADFATTHQAKFVFPYSHGLLAGLLWSALAGALALAWCGRLKEARWRVAVVVGAAVFSHWILDALVHMPEMPLAGGGSTKLGLGLWQSMPLALGVEGAILVAGLYFFLSDALISTRRKTGLAVLSLVVLAFTIAGMTIAPAPPSGFAMAASSLVAIVAVTAIACWLGRLARDGGR